MSGVTVAVILGANIALIFVLMALPIGPVTVRRRQRIEAPAHRVWAALWPLGADAGWSGEIISATPIGAGGDRALLRLSWLGRDGEPIEREVALSGVRQDERFAMRVVDDSSLDPAFWANFVEEVSIVPMSTDAVEVEIVHTDRYRGAAFLILRHFALRRRLAKLADWAKTGRYRPGGVFEHPLTQFGLAGVSVLLIWPLFGLTLRGLVFSALLTLVVALHELGHMAAFRVTGHRTTRMIFVPLLGGIAIGGRPYDSRFEVAFVALMGAGFSALLVLPALAFAASLQDSGLAEAGLYAGAFAGLLALFNLANLVPVWKFDGGQVLRQIAPNAPAEAGAACLLLGAFLWVGFAAGFSGTTLIVAGASLTVLSVITAGSAVKPKTALKPLMGAERTALAAGLVAVFVLHAFGVLRAAELLFA
jgi:Zn-dependent protease